MTDYILLSFGIKKDIIVLTWINMIHAIFPDTRTASAKSSTAGQATLMVRDKVQLHSCQTKFPWFWLTLSHRHRLC